MKTITLKTDDTFFEHVTSLAKSLDLTKSELIRRSIKEYEKYIKTKEMKAQIRAASYNVRKDNENILKSFESANEDGLKNV